MTSSPVFNAASSVATVRLQRNAHGRLVLTLPDGTQHADVVPVRAFPIAAPAEGISLVGTDGHELQWIEHLDHLPAAARALVEEDLNAREFVPILQKLVSVSGFSTPSTWSVETDRGPAQLVLKAEEDIRRLGDAPPCSSPRPTACSSACPMWRRWTSPRAGCWSVFYSATAPQGVVPCRFYRVRPGAWSGPGFVE